MNPAPELHPEEFEERIGGGGAAGVDGRGHDDDDELRVELLLAREEEGAEPQLPLRHLGGHLLQGLMEAMAEELAFLRTCGKMMHIMGQRRTERPLGIKISRFYF